mmetsp:Transcript_97862/g.253132  ORF Transcript_97862/g.253132 Transcript_97862/m.253132 type:complete len:301 (+) Transcript_97862:311-1213(+)
MHCRGWLAGFPWGLAPSVILRPRLHLSALSPCLRHEVCERGVLLQAQLGRFHARDLGGTQCDDRRHGNHGRIASALALHADTHSPEPQLFADGDAHALLVPHDGSEHRAHSREELPVCVVFVLDLELRCTDGLQEVRQKVVHVLVDALALVALRADSQHLQGQAQHGLRQPFFALEGQPERNVPCRSARRSCHTTSAACQVEVIVILAYRLAVLLLVPAVLTARLLPGSRFLSGALPFGWWGPLRTGPRRRGPLPAKALRHVADVLTELRKGGRVSSDLREVRGVGRQGHAKRQLRRLLP